VPSRPWRRKQILPRRCPRGKLALSSCRSRRHSLAHGAENKSSHIGAREEAGAITTGAVREAGAVTMLAFAGVRTLFEHRAVSPVHFSSDFQLRCLWELRQIRDGELWDVATGTEIRTLTGHTDHVRCVAFAQMARPCLWELRPYGEALGCARDRDPHAHRGQRDERGLCARWQDLGLRELVWVRLWDVATGIQITRPQRARTLCAERGLCARWQDPGLWE